MEVFTIQGYRETEFLKLLQPKHKFTLTEIPSSERTNHLKTMSLPVFPYLVLSNSSESDSEKTSIHGLRSIYTKLCGEPSQIVQTYFFLLERLYVHSTPICAHNSPEGLLFKSSVFTEKKEVVKQCLNHLKSVIAHKDITPELKHYGNYILTILRHFAIDLCGLEPSGSFNIDSKVVLEEVLFYVTKILKLPECYPMSPVPDKQVLLTTPIYYVNGVPHLGHVFTTTLVECIANWYKLRGIPCIYSTGTDEHGLKVQTTAAENNVSPQEWCDKTSKTFFNAFEKFDLHPDKFIRTTDEAHVKVATKLWNILLEKGYLYQGTYEGWYSKREECFVPENQVREEVVDGVKKHFNTEDGAELIWSSEVNWMFKLKEMQKPLLDWLDSDPNCITPEPYYKFIRMMVEKGFPDDLSVSRKNVSWGIPVPNDPGQTMYVWIDALANYLTVAGWDGENNMGIWPADLHTVGKDIVKFHAIFWPAFLLAAGIPVYKRLLVHGWWLVDKEKMSKSIGNVLDPVKMMEFWGLEPLKYYLLSECTLVNDSDYSDQSMLLRYNGSLADNLANVSMRVLSNKLADPMIVPQMGEMTADEVDFVEEIKMLPGAIDRFMQFGKTRKALEAIFERLNSLNKYLQVNKPWSLNKQDPERFKTVWYIALESLRMICVCLYPVMPQTSKTILKALGSDDLDPKKIFEFGTLKPGTQLTTIPVLFPKKQL